MDVELKPWQAVTLRSDGAFSVWTVQKDGSLGYIIGPNSSTDRRISFKAYKDPVHLRVCHKDGISITADYKQGDPDHEVLDQTPVEVPLIPPKTLQQKIDEQIRLALEMQAERDGVESPQEALDFDVDEDPDLVSKYELTPMQDDIPVEELINDLRGGKDDHGNEYLGDGRGTPEGSTSERSAEPVGEGGDRVSAQMGSGERRDQQVGQ